ncbi:MAG: hypothetical protein IPL12_02075 [Bacteroidetes bacterium]|nr:hypothetical protein [Bacteroidota bacterium]
MIEIEDEIEERKKKLISQVVDLILLNKISPTQIDPEKPLDFTFNQFQDVLLLTAYKIDKVNILNNLT